MNYVEIELRIRQLLQLMEMENNKARLESDHSDGWLYDHAQAIKEYSAQIDALFAELH